MAGEYSRELSTKVFAGQCRLIELGYRQGGMAGYGLRRMRVDQNGVPQGILGPGEYKSLQTDRVILVPGPEDEVENVRWMYHEFVEGGKRCCQTNANSSQYGNDKPILCSTELLPLNKSSLTLNLICISRI